MDFPASPSPDFAPPAASPERSPAPVLLAGAATTAAALAAQYFLNQQEINPLGFHLNYIIPAGAIGVGLVATGGFSLAAWKGGHRITGRVLFFCAAVLVAGYFAEQYLEYRQVFPDGRSRAGKAVGFWQFYEVYGRTMRFTSKRAGGAGKSLGVWGLGVLALRVAGFTLGGLVGPFALRTKSYCAPCGRYRNERTLAVVAAGIKPKLFGNDSPERVAQRTEKAQAAEVLLSAVLADAAKGDGASLTTRLASAGPPDQKSAATAADTRLSFSLRACPQCGDGELVVSKITGHGKQIRTVEVARQPIGRAVAEALKQGPAHQII